MVHDDGRSAAELIRRSSRRYRREILPSTTERASLVNGDEAVANDAANA